MLTNSSELHVLLFGLLIGDEQAAGCCVRMHCEGRP